VLTAGDEVFIAKVAELPPSLLQHLGDLDGIKTEDEAPYVFTPRLAFLAQFNEFVHARRNEDYAKASSLVVSLLNTDLSPVGIRAVLLADAVPLLEGEHRYPIPCPHADLRTRRAHRLEKHV
jgi:hypothetical protein